MRTKTDSPEVKRIAKLAFPEYKGRKFAFDVQNYPLDMRSYWDGGSRDYYKFVSLADGRVSMEVPVQSAFDPKISGLDSVTIPEGFVAVRHSIFCGKDSGLTVIANPANLSKLLPEGK
jgi:hypothetical protein